MSDIPASSSHATKAMEAAREIYWGSDWKEPYPLESQMSPEQILALNDMAAIISKYMPPSVSDISPEEVNKLVAVWKRLYELGQEPTWRRIEDITKIPLKEIWQHD